MVKEEICKFNEKRKKKGEHVEKIKIEDEDGMSQKKEEREDKKAKMKVVERKEEDMVT